MVGILKLDRAATVTLVGNGYSQEKKVETKYAAKVKGKVSFDVSYSPNGIVNGTITGSVDVSVEVKDAPERPVSKPLFENVRLRYDVDLLTQRWPIQRVWMTDQKVPLNRHKQRFTLNPNNTLYSKCQYRKDIN